MTLKKVRDSRRPDLEFVLIEPQDFNSEFYSELEAPISNQPSQPETPKSRKPKQEEVSDASS